MAMMMMVMMMVMMMTMTMTAVAINVQYPKSSRTAKHSVGIFCQFFFVNILLICLDSVLPNYLTVYYNVFPIMKLPIDVSDTHACSVALKRYFWIKYNLDRSTKHPKFNPTTV